MPVPTYVGASATPGSGTGAVTVAWPAGHAANDIGILVVENTTAQQSTVDAGWNLVASAVDDGGSRLSVYWMRATSAAMAAVNVSDAGDHQYAAILAFRGCETIGSPVHQTATGTKTTASTSFSAPGLTTTIPNTLIVNVISRDNDATGAAFSAQANASLTSLTERFDNGTNAGNGGGFSVVTGIRAAAGTVSATTGTVTSSRSAYVTLALMEPQLKVLADLFPTHLPNNRSATFAAQTAGGTAPFTWSVASGALPTGMTLNTSTGVVSGTPTVNGSYTFALRCTDSVSVQVTTASRSVIVRDYLDIDDVQLVHYVGNGGASVTVQTHGVDMSAGGFALIRPVNTAIESTAGAGALASVNGSQVYRLDTLYNGGLSSTTFGAEQLTIADASLNVSGVPYLAVFIKKRPQLCDVVEYTGIGASLTVPHSLGAAPAYTQPFRKVPNGAVVYGLWVSGRAQLPFELDIGLATSSGISHNSSDITLSSTAQGNISGADYVAVILGTLTGSWGQVQYTGTGTTALGAGPVVSSTIANPKLLWGASNNTGDNPALHQRFYGSSDGTWNGTVLATQMFANGNATSTTGATPFDISTGTLRARSTATNVSGQVYRYWAVGGQPGGQIVSPTGITTTETFGTATVTRIGGPLVLVGSAQTASTVNGFMYTDFETDGGFAPYTWSVSSGALPTGVTLDAATGVLQGTTTAEGVFNYTIRVTDSNSNFAEASFTTAVGPAVDMSGLVAFLTRNGVANAQEINIPLPFDITSSGGVILFNTYSQTSGSSPFPTGYSKVGGTTITLHQGVVYAGQGFNGRIEIDPEITITATNLRIPVASRLNTNFVGGTNMMVVEIVVFKQSPDFLEIIQYVGDGVTPRTLNHSLGSVPSAVFIHQMSDFHSFYTTSAWPKIDANNNAGGYFSSREAGPERQYSGRDRNYGTWFGASGPTSTSVQLTGNINNNVSGVNYFAYLFKGGNGVDPTARTTSITVQHTGAGTKVRFGFQPSLVLIQQRGYSGQDGVDPWAVIRGGARPTASPQGFSTGPFPSGLSSGAAVYTANAYTLDEGGLTQAVATQNSFSDPTGTYEYHYFAIRSNDYIPTGTSLVQPPSITTAEAFGTATVQRGAVTISPAGIASPEAFGTAALHQRVTATGIPSAEALGAATITSVVTVSPAGVATAEALGAATVTSVATVATAGIATGEAFGTAALSSLYTIAPAGVPTAEALGAAAVSATYGITGAGAIATGEAFGSAAVSAQGGVQNIAAAGAIATAEAFGTPTATPGAVSIAPSGIATAEALGTATVLRGAVTIAPTGIATAEAIGTATVQRGAVSVAPTGIPSAEALGSATVTSLARIQPTGLASAEAFGTTALLATYTVTVAGIGTAEAIGLPTATASYTIAPAGLASPEAFGSATVSARATIAPVGIASAEAFGTTFVGSGLTLGATGIPTAEAFGVATLTIGAVTLSPAGIGSAEALGTATITTGAVSVQPAGIPTAELLGSPVVLGTTIVSPAGIPTAEAVGEPAISIRVAAPGIPSAEAIGTPAVQVGAATIAPAGIPTAELVPATATITTGGVVVMALSIGSEEAVGQPLVVFTNDRTITIEGIRGAEAFGPGLYLILTPKGRVKTAIRATASDGQPVLRPVRALEAHARPAQLDPEALRGASSVPDPVRSAPPDDPAVRPSGAADDFLVRPDP